MFTNIDVAMKTVEGTDVPTADAVMSRFKEVSMHLTALREDVDLMMTVLAKHAGFHDHDPGPMSVEAAREFLRTRW